MDSIRRTRRGPGALLFLILSPLAAATVLGLAAMWPTGELPETGIVDVAAEYREATIVSAETSSCSGVPQSGV